MRESRAAKSQICQGPSFFVVTCPAAARAGAPGPGVGAQCMCVHGGSANTGIVHDTHATPSSESGPAAGRAAALWKHRKASRSHYVAQRAAAQLLRAHWSRATRAGIGVRASASFTGTTPCVPRGGQSSSLAFLLLFFFLPFFGFFVSSSSDAATCRRKEAMRGAAGP